MQMMGSGERETVFEPVEVEGRIPVGGA